jgi:hypothetical protein
MLKLLGRQVERCAQQRAAGRRRVGAPLIKPQEKKKQRRRGEKKSKHTSRSISNDTVGSPEVSNCVLGRFQGKSFPKPEQGCVTVQIPMSFEVKQ